MPVADVPHAALDHLDADIGAYVDADLDACIEAGLAALLDASGETRPQDPPPPGRPGGTGRRAAGADLPAPAARTRRPAVTAHPLVSKDTASLVAEALAAAGPAVPGRFPPASDALPVPAGALPGRLRASLPHWVHSRLGTRPRRPVTVGQHLLLTEQVLRRTGWAATGHRDRTTGGRRCILGAQHLLHSLGYGDVETARRAGECIDRALAAMGQSGPFWVWNDQPHVHEALVHRALRRAALLSSP